ncbi:MAG TPA: hypothetical protein DCR70_04860 [Phycisphaerales bacterium]|nr:hypothetical protein [Phycisphaerales bacterium]
MSGVVLLLVSSVALVLLFSALGVGAVWWALFGDKARTRRCPRCWHDLSGTPGMTCGECGHVAHHERELLQTRRRWGVAITALAGILVVTGWARLEILNASWVGFVPNGVLVQLPRLLPSGQLPTWAQTELNNRIVNGQLDGQHILDLIDVLDPGEEALGNPDDWRTPTLARATFCLPAELASVADEPVAAAEVRREARAKFVSTRANRLALFAPWIGVVVPTDWPVGVAPVAGVRGIVWGADTEWRVRLHDDQSNWLVGDGMSALRRQPGFGALQLPIPTTDGRIRATLDLETRRRDDGATAWNPWVAQPPLVIDAVVRPLDLAHLQPSDDPEITQTAREAFDFPVSIWTDDDRPAGIRFNTRAFAGAEYADMLIGVVLELRENGIARRRSHLWWPGSSLSRTGWEVDLEDVEALRRLRDVASQQGSLPADPDGGHSVPGWTMSVRGDQLMALRAMGALSTGSPKEAKNRFWSGQFETPLRVSERPESAPNRAFRRESRQGDPGTAKQK